MFCKLDGFLKTLYAPMGLVEWEPSRMSQVTKSTIYNMDKVGMDSTYHRTKVIAEALANIQQLHLTPEGDDRMNMHITLALTTCACGKYNCWIIVGLLTLYTHQTSKFRDEKNGIEGAPGLLCIHTDKLKTKAKEAKEREQQRQGEAPTNHLVSDCFKQGMEGCPEMLVVTTYSGSMTQDVFYLFVDHFMGL
jgi:hypothetical protein